MQAIAAWGEQLATTALWLEEMDRSLIPLRAVHTRPVRVGEVPRWNALMREARYLRLTKFCGGKLKQDAVLHCGSRDRWMMCANDSSV